MANYSNVTIKNTMLVYPSKQTQPNCTHLKLSNLDRKCPALMYLVFFYNKPTHLSKEGSFLRDLKKGLEETLSIWYPAAGRLCLDSESGRLDIECNNYGALLVEAFTQVQISALGDLSNANSNSLEKLVFRPPIFSLDRLYEVPLVVVQVTEFGCGGYAIGVGTSHALFDGYANFNFINAWASKTAGREWNQVLEPVHERDPLLLDHCQIHNAFSTSPMTTKVIAFDHLYQLIKQAISLQEFEERLEIETRHVDEEEFVLRTFTMSKDMVEKLKSIVTSSLGGISCTSFEVVAAHLWKARIRAIQVPKERRVCLQFSVNTRTRLSPPLSNSFTGNAYVLSSISSTCGDLLQEPLPSIVLKIKEAKLAVTDDYVRDYLSALNAPQIFCELPPLPELTVVSDWRQTPYNAVDFGVGDALSVVPLAAPLPEVVYLMNSGCGIDVRVGLMRKHLVGFSQCFMDALL